jgi:hypothetical protein
MRENFSQNKNQAIRGRRELARKRITDLTDPQNVEGVTWKPGAFEGSRSGQLQPCRTVP